MHKHAALYLDGEQCWDKLPKKDFNPQDRLTGPFDSLALLQLVGFVIMR